MKLILASASPRRRQLLALTGLDFEVIPANADEECNIPLEPDAFVVGLAARKARLIAQSRPTDDIIIAADTVVYCDGNILGKPKDACDAEKMLMLLSGRWHEVLTGFAVMSDKKLILDYDITSVKMRKIYDDECRSYISSGEPFDKAGGYGIQEKGGAFVERIEGNYHNVVGLPLCKLCMHLRNEFGITIPF